MPAQTYENIDIYICDDGSKDNTVELVRSYIDRNRSKKGIFLIENNGETLGCPKSFYAILQQYQPADYYSFCDQDDLWYPQKIEWAVECLEKESKDKACLYYAASDYKEEDGTFIRKSPLQKEHLSLHDVLYYTPGSGFTIVFNEKARQDFLLHVDPGTELHDRWIIRAAVCFGNLIYDSRSAAAHIRHKAAVTAGEIALRMLFFLGRI